MKVIRQHIQEKSFQSVYLLYGEEAYLRQNYKKELQKAISGDDTMNYQYFEGKGIDVVAVRDFCETLPFFADYRLAIVENSGLFSTSSEAWAKMLPELPDTTILVFVEEKVDKRNKLYKSVKELGYIAELKKPDDRELSRWVAGMAKRAGKNITVAACETFVERTSESMENMRMEFQKLLSYVGERSEIYPADVEAITTEQISNQIFRMMDAMAEGKETVALNLYYDLLALKEPSMRILFLISRQINQLLQVRELMGSGMGRDAVASRCKIPAFAAGKLINQARAFSGEQLRSYVALCVSAEEGIKTGELQEKIAVELVLLTITRRETVSAKL